MIQSTLSAPIEGTPGQQAQIPQHQHSFVMLDALRGVAAIAVMAFHSHELLGFQPFPRGYIAVDFFFMLSGFVLALAYQPRLDASWPTLAFLKTRVARLYPLYLLGLLVGVLVRMTDIASGTLGMSHLQASILLALGLLLIPAPLGLGAHGRLFPFNLPSWSLFMEIFANVFHAWFLRRRSSRFLFAVVFGTVPLLLLAAYRIGSLDFGVWLSEIFYGMARVIFSYTLGLLLFRVWRRGSFSGRVPPWLVALLLLATMAVPASGRWTSVYDLSVIFFVFPMLLLLGAASNPSPRFAAICTRLGAASYAIYVLHLPIEDGLQKLWIAAIGVARWPFAVGCMVLIVGLSIALDRIYDQPFRNYLRARLVPRRAKS